MLIAVHAGHSAHGSRQTVRKWPWMSSLQSSSSTVARGTATFNFIDHVYKAVRVYPATFSRARSTPDFGAVVRAIYRSV